MTRATRAVTLVEMAVGIGVAAILGAMMISLTMQASVFTQTQVEYALGSQELNSALEVLGRDIAALAPEAGALHAVGCVSGDGSGGRLVLRTLARAADGAPRRQEVHYFLKPAEGTSAERVLMRAQDDTWDGQLDASSSGQVLAGGPAPGPAARMTLRIFAADGSPAVCAWERSEFPASLEVQIGLQPGRVLPGATIALERRYHLPARGSA